METKALLYGLIGFFFGGLIVSLAASWEGSPSKPAAESSQMQQIEGKK